MSNPRAVVFDLYGTLYDVHSVLQQCDASYPGLGAAISALWRQKQLEYTWLRSLMGQYVSFEYVTYDALVYTCKHFKLDLDFKIAGALTDAYLSLTPYADVPDTLRQLKEMELPMVILSNGSVFSSDRVVKNSGLEGYFSHLLSVESVEVFKPILESIRSLVRRWAYRLVKSFLFRRMPGACRVPVILDLTCVGLTVTRIRLTN